MSLSIRDRWAQHHVDEALRKWRERGTFEPGPAIPPSGDGHGLPPSSDIKVPLGGQSPGGIPPKIAIIGAGAAGLFTALLIDYLNANVPGLNVQYDIFDSQTQVGGRLYTYNFGQDSPHLYYDVGAMRFPENKIMARYARI